MSIRVYNQGKLLDHQEINSIQQFTQGVIDYLRGITIARQSINKKYISFIKSIEGDILEIGGNKSFQEYMSNGNFLVLDIEYKPTNNITANAEHLPLASETISGVICISVLEHTQYPQKIIEEIWRCLKPGGKAFISVPWLFETHMEPQDFYRFSNFILGKWFFQFNTIEIEAVNGYFGLLAHFLQRFKVLSYSIGILCFCLDKFSKHDFRWATQINLILEKPIGENVKLSYPQNHWFENLRCPDCLKQKQGELDNQDSKLVCNTCQKEYILTDTEKVIFNNQ
jgi:SAM-dependent methyltransferase